MILVISSQSNIGKNFILYKKNKNISSSFHKKKIFQNSNYFYLGKSNPNKIINNKIKVCLLLITLRNKKLNIKKFDEFTNNFKFLINNLIKKNIHIIFLSTETVYENLKKRRHLENSELRPSQPYAKHKIEIEKFITANTKKYSILRIGRVCTLKKDKNNILTQISDQISNSYNKNLKFADDYEFSPLFIQDLNRILDQIIKKKIYGCYNLCGNQSLTYYKIAKKIIYKLKLNSNIKIIKRSIKNFSKITKAGSISMNNSKFKKLVDFKYISFDSVITKYLKSQKLIR